MNAVLTFGAIVLALPLLVLVAIAMGPVALVLLYIGGFTALILLAGGAVQRRRR